MQPPAQNEQYRYERDMGLTLQINEYLQYFMSMTSNHVAALTLLFLPFVIQLNKLHNTVKGELQS